MNSSANRMVGELATSRLDRPVADVHLPVGRPGRELSLYPASMGYHLQHEIDFLANRVADSGETFARIGAAFASSLDHASDAYALEKERQFQRRVDRLAKLANIK